MKKWNKKLWFIMGSSALSVGAIFPLAYQMNVNQTNVNLQKNSDNNTISKSNNQILKSSKNLNSIYGTNNSLNSKTYNNYSGVVKRWFKVGLLWDHSINVKIVEGLKEGKSIASLLAEYLGWAGPEIAMACKVISIVGGASAWLFNHNDQGTGVALTMWMYLAPTIHSQPWTD